MYTFYHIIRVSNAHIFNLIVMLAGSGFLLISHIELSRAEDMAYFKDPMQAVELITAMLVSEAWEELSSYYDLSDTDIDRNSLISGDFFILKKRPEVAHPAGFWRYKEPFAPGFNYLAHHTVYDNIVKVTVQIEIDQGGGMMQVGRDSFHLRQSLKGYQLLPKSYKPTPSDNSEEPLSLEELKQQMELAKQRDSGRK